MSEMSEPTAADLDRMWRELAAVRLMSLMSGPNGEWPDELPGTPA